MSKLTRRDLIKRLSIGLAASPVYVALATRNASAGETSPDAGSAKTDAGSATSEAGAGARKNAAPEKPTLTCDDTTGLSESQVKVREALRYTDDTPNPGQICSNCVLYKSAQVHGHCGGCQTVPGRIHPGGWCSAWVRKKD